MSSCMFMFQFPDRSASSHSTRPPNLALNCARVRNSPSSGSGRVACSGSSVGFRCLLSKISSMTFGLIILWVSLPPPRTFFTHSSIFNVDNGLNMKSERASATDSAGQEADCSGEGSPGSSNRFFQILSEIVLPISGSFLIFFTCSNIGLRHS